MEQDSPIGWQILPAKEAQAFCRGQTLKSKAFFICGRRELVDKFKLASLATASNSKHHSRRLEKLDKMPQLLAWWLAW